MRVNVLFARPCRLAFFPDARQLRRLLAAMLAANAACKLEYADLAIVDDGAIAALNRQCLNLEGPTNILSFPDPPAGALYLSLDTLIRECRLYGQKPIAHLARLLAHGLAHLDGLEHGPEMEKLEAMYFAEGMAFLAADEPLGFGQMSYWYYPS